jgi:hypothetical protein
MLHPNDGGSRSFLLHGKFLGMLHFQRCELLPQRRSRRTRIIPVLLRGCELHLVLGDHVVQLLALALKDLVEIGNLRLRLLCRRFSLRRPEIGFSVEGLLDVPLARFAERLLMRLCYRRTMNMRNNKTTAQYIKDLRGRQLTAHDDQLAVLIGGILHERCQSLHLSLH